MGAPDSSMQAADQPAAETLLSSLRTIKPAERARHEGVLNYWLSIRGDKEFPPLHDLDPLEISDAGPNSILLELIGGGQDAEIRHLGDGLKDDIAVQRIIDAANPSILSSIAKKLPIVAISRDFLAFEDSFSSGGGQTRCWVTLLPLSSCGSWVDYVYAFISLEKSGAKAAKAPEPEAAVEEAPAEEPVAEEVEAAAEPVVEEVAAEEPVAEEVEAAAEPVAEETEAAPDIPEEPEIAEDTVPFVAEEPVEELLEPVGPVESVEAGIEPEPVAEPEPEPEPEPQAELGPEPEPEPELEPEQPAAKGAPGFSKLLEGFASLTGFYGQGVKVEDPVVQAELPPVEPPASEPEAALEPEAEAPADEPHAVEPVAEAEEPIPADEPVAIEPPAEGEPLELSAEEPAPEAAAEEPSFEPESVPAPAPAPAPAMEGSLQSKLTEVRAKADEAREARLRAVAALHEGLSAAYDFALDAETSPEEYLRLVEAQGLKIQLRAPMAPVARLAFGDSCEPATIKQLEAILAWALKEELPRGGLIERIDQAGGISELAGEVAKAA